MRVEGWKRAVRVAAATFLPVRHHHSSLNLKPHEKLKSFFFHVYLFIVTPKQTARHRSIRAVTLDTIQSEQTDFV